MKCPHCGKIIYGYQRVKDKTECECWYGNQRQDQSNYDWELQRRLFDIQKSLTEIQKGTSDE